MTLGLFMANRFVMEMGRDLLCFCKAVVALLNLVRVRVGVGAILRFLLLKTEMTKRDLHDGRR